MNSTPEKSEAPTLGPVEASLNHPFENNRQENQVVNSTQGATSRAITVPFHGADLYVVEHNGQPYTPMKPIVEGMGLAWQPQHRKLAANEARRGITIMVMPLQGVSESETPSGGAQKMLAMPLRKLPGWLATIDPGRVKNEDARAKVVEYQNECDDVLWHYWNEGIAINPRAAYAVNPGDVLTADEAETLRLMLKTAADRLPKEKQGALMVMGWSKLKAHFKVGYREIPRHEFSEAVSIIARHTAEWEVVDEVDGVQPDAERIKRAFVLASEVAAVAQRTVFDALIDGRAADMSDRWMFCTGHPKQGGVAVPWAKPIERNAMVVSMEDLPRRLLDPNGICPSNQDLANLAAACNHRLAQRMLYQAQKRGEA